MQIIFFVGIIAAAFGWPGAYRHPMINDGMLEGDILMDPFEDLNAIPNDNLLWPNGILYYAISPELYPIKPLILKSMQHLESRTCIRFVERTNQNSYIFIHYGPGCFSALGRAGGMQLLSLGEYCDNFAIIMHELIHAIGFMHEHNRSDRDDYITINWQNIYKENYKLFQKLAPHENRLLTKFDYESIMLYGSRLLAKDPMSDNYSMVRKDGSFIDSIEERTSISDLDATEINMLYRCFNNDIYY